MSKTLLEWLKRYQPSSENKALLLMADPESIQFRVDKDLRAMEIRASFPQYISKQTLYQIEEEIRRAYDLSYMRLLPSFPSACFSEHIIPFYEEEG